MLSLFIRLAGPCVEESGFLPHRGSCQNPRLEGQFPCLCRSLSNPVVSGSGVLGQDLGGDLTLEP